MYNSKKHSVRRVISTVLVFALLATFMVPFTSISAVAAAPTKYTTITSGSYQSVSVSATSDSKYYKFVPTVGGNYTFYSSSCSGDPFGALLDSNGDYLLFDDNGAGNGKNFSITYDCVANSVYYIEASFINGSSGSSASYRLNVKLNYSTGTVTPSTPPANALNVTAGANTYSLFNSGATASGYGQYTRPNPAPDTHNNNGYDLYGGISNSSYSRFRLGLSFVVNANITEQATLNIKAYDVDEDMKDCGSGYEYDYIYLVDETTGKSVKLDGHMSGQNNTWNNSTFKISPDKFQSGHSYHFELQMTCTGSHSCSYYSVIVRTVALVINGEQTTQTGIEKADLSASISPTGLVSVTLDAKAYTSGYYTLEYKAVYASNGAQKGGKEYSVTIPTQQTPFGTEFQLESEAQRGTYIITLFLKDSLGNVLTTREYTASYGYSAVSYNSNGGSQNLPSDLATYSSGNTVTVLFNYIPSRSGYTFLGWARSSSATTPEFTSNGNKTFTIGSSDVTLYAVWEKIATHKHTESAWIVDTKPSCETVGLQFTECLDCGELMRVEYIPTTPHDYETVASVEATCVTDGYITMICSGCHGEKHQIIYAPGHSFGSDHVCDVCGFEIEVHNHEYVTMVVDPTCSAVGYTVYSCTCGHTYRADYVDQRGHRWNDGVVTTAATCTTDGIMTYSCTKCAASYTEIIPAAHKWEETVTVPATCTTDGELLRVCSVCRARETEKIPAAHTWNAGTVLVEATCTTEGSKRCTCTVCGKVETLPIPVLGHHFVNGSCTRCGATIPDIVVPNTDHPQYGMYFEIDDIISNYGPDYINEYGVLLDYNAGAKLRKVAVYLTQDGTMWRRCIACVGDGITYATYVPYLSYDEDIKYTGLNSSWINIFKLSPNSDGIWCYSDYTTIGVNLEDRYGNLLLSLYDIGQAGAKTRIFDDLDEMIAWLKEDSDCITHNETDWIVEIPGSCTTDGYKYTKCTTCGIKVREEREVATGHVKSEWIVTEQPTTVTTGYKIIKCTKCETVLDSMVMPVLSIIEINDVSSKAGATVNVTVSIQNNPGVLGAVLTLYYDPALTLLDVKSGGAWSSLNLTNPGSYKGECRFVWDGVNAEDRNNGTILTLTFQVPQNAKLNTVYDVGLFYSAGDIINGAGENLDIAIDNGSIRIIRNLKGDVNDDGVVDVADVITLRRYLSSGYNVTINEAQTDMNNDGKITIADLVELRRYIVNQ